MTNGKEMPPAWRRLLNIAREFGIAVHLFSCTDCGDDGWDGLYIVHPKIGRGIAICEDLPPQMMVWVLAHELGHRMAWVNPTLFSPFSRCATGLAAYTNSRTGRSRKLDSDEERANEWAARELIGNDQWREAENQTPRDLNAIAVRLGLPIQAVLAWERMRRKSAPHFRPLFIDFDRETRAALRAATEGKGGHQSLFSRIRNNRHGATLGLTFRDFSIARERLLTVRGGWRYPYERVVNGALPSIARAGGVTAAFALE